MRRGRKRRQLPLNLTVIIRQTQRALHPCEDSAAVRERASEYEPLPVQAIAEEPVGNVDHVCLDYGPHRAARSHHQGEAIARDAPAAEVVAGAIAQRRIPGYAA